MPHVFRDADLAKAEATGNEADAGPRGPVRDRHDAYARNVFYDVGESFGVFEPSGRWHKTLQAFREALESYQPLAAQVGVMAEQSPLRDPTSHDFRPSANSAAHGQGTRVFVPWSLHETVGEWNFNPIPGDRRHPTSTVHATTPPGQRSKACVSAQGVNVTLKDTDGLLEN
jgi:hypothetical protein